MRRVLNLSVLCLKTIFCISPLPTSPWTASLTLACFFTACQKMIPTLQKQFKIKS